MVDSTPNAGTFTATGVSDRKAITGNGVVSISGIASSTVILQRSVNSGTSWVDVKTYTADATENITEVETDVFYRLNCTVYGSGTITYRLASGRNYIS
jgi:hypothetical protein